MSPKIQGIAWMVAAGVVSALNDAFTKGAPIPPALTVWFRFAFGTAFLLMLFPSAFRTSHVWKHAVRGFVLWIAMLLWGVGMKSVPMPLITSVGFLTPIWVLLMTHVFLKERLSARVVACTALGFLGILVAKNPWNASASEAFGVPFLMAATVLFATLDTINKHLLGENEPLPTMLLHSSLWTLVFCTPMAAWVWTWPSAPVLTHLAVLGAGSNLILFCLLKAFSLAPLSVVQPFRYTELLFSVGLGVAFFQEQLSAPLVLGGVLVGLSAFLALRAESN